MSKERDDEQALDTDVPDPAVGGGNETTVSKPASQEGVGEDEGQDGGAEEGRDGGVESVEEIAERSD